MRDTTEAGEDVGSHRVGATERHELTRTLWRSPRGVWETYSSLTELQWVHGTGREVCAGHTPLTGRDDNCVLCCSQERAILWALKEVW